MRIAPYAAVGLALCCAACASTGATPRPFPMPPDRRMPVESPEGRIGSAIDGYALVGTALQLRGVSYKNGGSDPSGFDCSGFTQYVFGRYGVSLPRAAQDQYNTGEPVKRDQLAPGDLIFFTTTAPGASHVAIAIGGGDQFVHAPSSTGVVRVERLSASYWAARFVGARRVIAGE